ncbi:MAG TPA: hypothetical protein VKA60_14440 [Blastocatellia bacterium]|nr:hypothetical protein [Blastocatellia bacterium]
MRKLNFTSITQRRVLAIIAAGIMLIAAPVGRAQSVKQEDGPRPLAQQKTAIVGSWEMTYTFPDLPPPFNTTRVLAAFTGDGIFLSSMQGESAASEDPLPPATPQYGAWAYVGGRQYAVTYKLILYRLATGAFFGTAKIPLNITIDKAGEVLTGTGTFAAYDADGGLIFSVGFTLQATRIKVE